MKRYLLLVSVVVLITLLGVPVKRAAAQDSPAIVHAVLFYSPTCGHCEFVIEEVLPPLYEEYGSQLQIIGFDVSQPQGQNMFRAALGHFGVEQPAVPFLVIDDITLVGSQEIPEQFPELIEGYLAIGGVSWPEIPGLREMLIAAAQTATAQPPAQLVTEPAASTPESGVIGIELDRFDWRERFAADAVANTIALVILVGMLGALAWSLRLFRGGPGADAIHGKRTWTIPAVCLLGFVVAGYLAYVEATGQRAVCGPIGDCNTVQQSPYARLFGMLSVGTLGLIGYAAMMIAWAVARFGREPAAAQATKALFIMALLGTLFSIYLTFLEPFIIGATCAWCLASAVLTTALMLLSAGAAGREFSRPWSGSELPRKRDRSRRKPRSGPQT